MNVTGHGNQVAYGNTGHVTQTSSHRAPVPAPRPSIGRIVHYVSHGSPIREDGTQAYVSECRAAIVTERLYVDDAELHDSVGLAVLNPTGMFFNHGVAHHEPESGDPLVGGTWHWPERV